MPRSSRQRPLRTRTTHLLAGLLASSLAVAACALVAGPAQADTPPTVPDTATGTGVAGSAQWPVVNGSAGLPTVTGVGLTPLSHLAPDGTALGDASHSGGGTASSTDATAPGVHTWTLTVPQGTTAIVLTESISQYTPSPIASLPSITLTGVPDGGGAPVSRTADDQTITDTLTWTSPPAGTYTAEVDTPAGDYDFDAYTAVVAPSTVDPGSVPLLAQANPDDSSSDPADNTVINATWAGLLADTTYYGTVSYSDSDAVTLLEVDSGPGYALTPIENPSLSGPGTVGTTLSVNPGTWTVANPTFTYQWYRDDEPVAGATSSTYPVTAADAGHTLRADVTASAREYESWTQSAASIAVQLGSAYAVKQPTVSGTPRLGKTLTAHPGTWNTSGLRYGYQWTAAGQPIAGATSPTLRLITGMAGKAVGVTITNLTEGYKATTARSVTMKVLATPTLRLKLTEKKVHGTRRVVATVTATAAVPVTGKVHLTIGTVHRTLTLRGERATTNVVHTKAGKVTARVTYGGSGAVASATAKASVRLR